MKKELKFFFYIIFILIFCLLTSRYYFSDINKKKTYRSISSIDEKIKSLSENIPVLKSNTDNIIEYVDLKNDNIKKFNFWKLLNNEN